MSNQDAFDTYVAPESDPEAVAMAERAAEAMAANKTGGPEFTPNPNGFGPRDKYEAHIFAQERLRFGAQHAIRKLMRAKGIDEVPELEGFPTPYWQEDEAELTARQLGGIFHMLGEKAALVTESELTALRASHALLRRYGEALRDVDTAVKLANDAIRDGGYVDGYLLAIEDKVDQSGRERDAALAAVKAAALTLAAAATPGGENQ